MLLLYIKLTTKHLEEDIASDLGYHPGQDIHIINQYNKLLTSQQYENFKLNPEKNSPDNICSLFLFVKYNENEPKGKRMCIQEFEELCDRIKEEPYESACVLMKELATGDSEHVQKFLTPK